MRLIRLLMICPVAAGTLGAQRPDTAALGQLLRSSIRVEIAEPRFVSMLVDSVAPTVAGAPLVNGYRRLYEYLVEHQTPPSRLYAGVSGARDPQRMVVNNLLADSAATRSLMAYLGSTGPARSRSRMLQRASPTQITTIAARFFYPMVTPDRTVVSYRCAGINGIESLGAARDGALEAFAFWAIAPTIFDADSATPPARALKAEFVRAMGAFRRDVEAAAFDTATVSRAREVLFAQMASSPALAGVLRTAYIRHEPQLPFRVPAWR